MSPNRVVAVLTPLLFAPLAGAIAAWLAEHFPGIQVDRDAVEKIFIAGALTALAPATQWLHGWQKHEARQAELQRDVAVAGATAPAMAVSGPAPQLASFEDASLGQEDTAELDEADDLEELAEDDGLDELDALEDLDDLSEDDELDDFDDMDDADDLDGFDELDEELLDEAPTVAGS
jgi:hypothetical protein